MKYLNKLSLVIGIILVIILMVSTFAGGVFSQEKLMKMVYQSVWLRSTILLMGTITLFCAVNRSFKKFQSGFFLTHVAFVFFCLASILGAIKGFKGEIQLFESHPANQFLEVKKGEAKTLPFTLLLNQFWMEFYPAPPGKNLIISDQKKVYYNSPLDKEKILELKGFKVRVRKIEKSEKKTPYEIIYRYSDKIKDSFQICIRNPQNSVEKVYNLKQGITTEISEFNQLYTVKETLLDFVISDGKASDRSKQPNNPAVKILITEKTTGEHSDKWLFSKFPSIRGEMHSNGGSEGFGEKLEFVVMNSDNTEGKVQTVIEDLSGMLIIPGQVEPLRVEYGRQQGPVQGYFSDMTVLENNRKAMVKIVKVNDPLYFKGYYIYQKSYGFDEEMGKYSVLDVVYDPGLPFFYAGCVSLMIGVFIMGFFSCEKGEKNHG